MRLLCVGRHRYLSEHICRFFRAIGAEARPAVGLAAALEAARHDPPDVVVCDYDLLASGPIRQWEREPAVASIPLVAVSLTRRPDEAYLLDVSPIAGFLYLPTLGREDAARLLELAQRGRGVVPRGPTPGSIAELMAERPTPAR
jgi:DNA-binding NarL/FixJ family response regulator